MDQVQARALLAGERARLQQLLHARTGQPQAAELGDEVQDADWRNAEQTGMAVDQLLQARWAALQRAEARLAAGSYGRSVHSGQPIPDERLEADPLAELTVQEVAAAERGVLEEGEEAVGLVSANHPFEVLADADVTPEEEHAGEEDDDEPGLGAQAGHPHRARQPSPIALRMPGEITAARRPVGQENGRAASFPGNAGHRRVSSRAGGEAHGIPGRVPGQRSRRDPTL